MTKKLKILFLCTGNSCRSQMAEGWAKALKGELVEASSAGVERHGLNPFAVKAMAEAGVDIAKHVSKTLDELPSLEFDFVVTVCDRARESCPVFPGRTKVVHIGFDDPPSLAKDETSDEAKMRHYRKARDEIRDFIKTIPENLKKRS